MVSACVRLRGVPVGVVAARASTGLRDFHDRIVDRLGHQLVAAMARHAIGRPVAPDPVASSLDPATPPAGNTADVSVILSEAGGGDLDAALSRITSSRRGEETILVGRSAEKLAAIAARDPSVRFAADPQPGLGRARNRAVAMTTRPIIAFTREQVYPDARWAQEISGFFTRNPDASALTGLVLPLEPGTGTERGLEVFGGHGRRFSSRWDHAGAGDGPIAAKHCTVGSASMSANIAFRRSALEAVGGFHEGMYRGAGPGVDLEVLFRILKAEGLIGYWPPALVRQRYGRGYEALAGEIHGWGSGLGACLTSISHSFPEEGDAVRELRRRLLATWSARRWVTSLVLRRTRHDLMRQQLRGLRRGPLLVESGADTRAFQRIHPPASSTPAAVAVVETSEPVVTIEVPPDTDRVRIFVRREGRSIGRMVLPAIGGAIGTDRLSDEIATRFAEPILGMSEGSAQRRLRHILHSLSRAA